MAFAALVVLLLAVPQTPAPAVVAAVVAASPGAHRVSAALGDVDGDGTPDLVIGRNGALAMRRGAPGAGPRQFAPEAPLGLALGVSCESAGQPRLCDVDGDGGLDLLAIDAPLGAGERIVWAKNDRAGAFAAWQPLRFAGGAAPVRWPGPLSAVDLGDFDGDGKADLLVACRSPWLHRGGPDGFAAVGVRLADGGAGAAAFADWDRDGGLDVLRVEGQRLVVCSRRGGGLGEAQDLAEVRGDGGMAQLAVGDWDGDGRVDVLLGETAPAADAAAAPRDPRSEAERDEQRRAANEALAAIQAAIERLNQTPPPRDDAAAMARRAAWRERLEVWAAGPKGVLKELAAPVAVPTRSGVRAVLAR
jgi:hypothetical protein